jgi:uncharacterized protein
VSVERLRTLSGRALAEPRRKVHRFLSRHSTAGVAVQDIRQLEAFIPSIWKSDQRTNDEQERLTLQRLLGLARQAPLKLTCFGVRVQDALSAFAVFEDVGRGFSICHFEKADTLSYADVIPFFRQQVASALSERGIRFINLEQDLGIEGLRRNKRSYAPVLYLKKYAVRYACPFGSAA